MENRDENGANYFKKEAEPEAMRYIQLTKGHIALVDDDDYERLGANKWFANWNQCTKSYYASRNSPRKKGEKHTVIRMHREVMQAKPGEHVDHINRDTLDNQKSNLRLCTRSQNNAHKGVRANNTSGLKGVCWHKRAQKWTANISTNGKRSYLGIYATKEEAARRYDAAAIEQHGEFSITNQSMGLLK
jgi:AP2 domain/HNH endonuclease